MFCKLAFTNVRRSVRDYTVYFLTLLFGICMFYMFNSVDAQQSMLILSKSQSVMMESLTFILGYMSGFVAVILGFLILYANKFLIKRRKKELGIYMLLGMPKGKLSAVLVLETLLIGVVSLAVGLALGVFLSQGLSVVTARLFAVDLSDFHFVFSPAAFVKSLCYFGVIYLIVMAFNVFTVSRCRLITLLTAAKKNETMRVRSLGLSVFLFAVSIVCLMAAYRLILENGMLMIDGKFRASILLGIIGTFLFFVSLSGFLLRIVKADKRTYYRGLNLFVLRQLNAKINTTFVSMTVICLLLLCTIGGLSVGLGLSQSMTKKLHELTPFGATVITYTADDAPEDLKEVFHTAGLEAERYMQDSVALDRYSLGEITGGQMVRGTEPLLAGDPATAQIVQDMMERPATALRQSQYNEVMRKSGRPELQLGAEEFAISANYETILPYLEQFLAEDGTVSLDGRTYRAALQTVRTESFQVSQMAENTGILILPDAALEAMQPDAHIYNFDLPESDPEGEAFVKQLRAALAKEEGEKVSYSFLTRQIVYDQNLGTSTMATYLAVYLGLAFLITCAAVLALQQLSEAADNIGRYSLLRKLGAEEWQLNRALFVQILIYFLTPLLLAAVHSVVGLRVANSVIEMFGKVNLWGNLLVIAGLFVVVYGGYFLATYFGSKTMIRARGQKQ